MMAEVVVVGAGLIGLSSAYYLLADGHRVTVIDRDPAGDKASFGNAGGIGVSEIVPAAVPGLIWRVPGWLVDPLGPLSLRPQHLPALIPWLWRFLRSGRRSEIPRITAALAAIADHTYDDLVPLMAAIGLAGDLHMAGAMSVYETREGFERDRPEWALKQRFGTICEEIGGEEARAREPALGPIVKHAIVTPQWAHVSDPKRIVDRLRDHVAAQKHPDRAETLL
jgi:D-amino-acid dehydrogenase